MANDKYYGYSPKAKKGSVGVPYGNDNRLDRVNPYEFKKGMDYELSTMGISRLSESTPDQRQVSTDKVLKNLGTHPSFYSCKIQFESEYRNFDGRKPSFKKYLKEKEEYKMKPVDQEYKNDKMVTLKEAIKNEIRSILSENKLKEGRKVVKVYQSWGKGKKANLDDLGEDNYGFDPRAIAQYFTPDGIAKEDVSVFEMSNGSIELHASGDKDKFHEAKGKDLDGDGDIDSDDYLKAKDNAIKKATGKTEVVKEEEDEDDVTAKKATKGAKKAAKGVKGIEKEIAKLKDEKKSLKDKIAPLMAKFNSKELDKDQYLKKVGDTPKRIKTINGDIAKLEKDLDAALVKETDDTREVAMTAMDRDVNRRLLEIIKESGISLHEGAQGVKMYYDIARKAYMEGLTSGLNRD